MKVLGININQETPYSPKKKSNKSGSPSVKNAVSPKNQGGMNAQ